VLFFDFSSTNQTLGFDLKDNLIEFRLILHIFRIFKALSKNLKSISKTGILALKFRDHLNKF